MLRKSPVFTAVSVFTLALGIGAVTTLYSVVQATLLDPLPFRDGERLAVLWTENESEGQDRYFVSPQDFGDWRELNTTFESMAARSHNDWSFLPAFGAPEQCCQIIGH